MDDAEFYSYCAAKKTFILAKNRKAHLEFAKTHRNWTVEQWGQILWLDELKFNLKGSNGKRNVRRPVDKRLKQVYTIGTMKHGGGKGLMV